jgi:hypothetical protein
MGPEGIEPPSIALEAIIMPLYYGPIIKLKENYCF